MGPALPHPSCRPLWRLLILLPPPTHQYSGNIQDTGSLAGPFQAFCASIPEQWVAQTFPKEVGLFMTSCTVTPWCSEKDTGAQSSRRPLAPWPWGRRGKEGGGGLQGNCGRLHTCTNINSPWGGVDLCRIQEVRPRMFTPDSRPLRTFPMPHPLAVKPSVRINLLLSANIFQQEELRSACVKTCRRLQVHTSFTI